MRGGPRGPTHPWELHQPNLQGLAGTVGRAVSPAPAGPGRMPPSTQGWTVRLCILEVESAEEGGPEGTQVQVPILLMSLTDIGGHQSIRVVQASPEGPTVAELQDQAVPRHKLHHRLQAEQLQGKSRRGP